MPVSEPRKETTRSQQEYEKRSVTNQEDADLNYGHLSSYPLRIVTAKKTTANKQKPTKQEIELPYKRTIPLLGKYPRKETNLGETSARLLPSAADHGASHHVQQTQPQSYQQMNG